MLIRWKNPKKRLTTSQESLTMGMGDRLIEKGILPLWRPYYTDSWYTLLCIVFPENREECKLDLKLHIQNNLLSNIRNCFLVPEALMITTCKHHKAWVVHNFTKEEENDIYIEYFSDPLMAFLVCRLWYDGHCHHQWP